MIFGDALPSKRGAPNFPVAVDAKPDREAPATWVRVALFGDAVRHSPEAQPKGAEVTARCA
jgi:hypothetical protein